MLFSVKIGGIFVFIPIPAIFASCKLTLACKNKIGRDKFINKPGEDEITKALLNKLGKEKLLQLLDRLDRETDQDL